MYAMTENGIDWAADERWVKSTRKHTCKGRKVAPGEVCKRCEHDADQILRLADGHTSPEGRAYRAQYLAPDADTFPQGDDDTDEGRKRAKASREALEDAAIAQWLRQDALDKRVNGDALAVLASLPVGYGRGDHEDARRDDDPQARWDEDHDAQRAALRVALGQDTTGHMHGALRALADREGRALPERAKRRHSTRDRVGSVTTGAHAAYLAGALAPHVARSVLGRVTDAYAVTVTTAPRTRPDAPDGKRKFRGSDRPDPATYAGPVVHTTADGTRVYAVSQTVSGKGDEREVTTTYAPILLSPEDALVPVRWGFNSRARGAARWGLGTGWAADTTTREGDALMALREGPGPVRKPSRKGSKGGGRLGTSAVVTSHP